MANITDLEDDVVYRVKFMRVVKLGRVELLPRPEHAIIGSALKTIIEQEGADVIDFVAPLE
jgi:hypothetical protein